MTRLSDYLVSPRPYLTDGGLETSLIFHQGFDLPAFAAYVLYASEEGRAGLRRYVEPYLRLAVQNRSGFLLDTATWRAGTRWGAVLGDDDATIRRINAEAVAFAHLLRQEWEREDSPILVNGIVGPAGDGYSAASQLSPSEAEALHWPQIEALATAGVDLVTLMTMTHPGEAIGAVRAAAGAGVPVAVSFTVETDGALPNGQSLAEALAEVEAAGAPVLYYGINCAHPTHYADKLRGGWAARVGALRSNASRLSHAALDAAEALDDGDPVGFGLEHAALARLLPALRVVGGCCGTDLRHVGCAATGLHAGRAGHFSA